SELFFVIATQNPVEFRGTYPLPEAQMDRFAVQLSLGYVAPEEEVEILSAQAQRHPIDTLTACLSIEDVLDVRRRATGGRMSDELKRYVGDVVRETRAATGVQLGASPRASLALMKASQALALTEGREFVIPEDVREMAVPVIAHRMVAEPQARFAGVTTAGIVEEILTKLPSPSWRRRRREATPPPLVQLLLGLSVPARPPVHARRRAGPERARRRGGDRARHESHRRLPGARARPRPPGDLGGVEP